MSYTPSIAECQAEIDAWIGEDESRRAVVNIWRSDAMLGELQIVRVIWALSVYGVAT